MLREMVECARPLSSKDIELLESELGFRLPAEYRPFLFKYNGGRPLPNCFPIKGLEKNPFGALHYFFGVEDSSEAYNLTWNYDTFNGRMPSNLFPIASTGSDDVICLSLFGPDAGTVLFWDWYGQTGEPTYDNVYHIADSFSEFLDSLHELPDQHEF